jgi:CDP-2,3-bis-(O-geranylgeranyl)-sn-glycerol synthase
MLGSVDLAVFLLVTMSMAGVVHALWLRWARADLLQAPVDFGGHFRGRRLFGDNKRLRGFIAMPLAAAGAFVAVGALRGNLPFLTPGDWWEFPLSRFASIGFAAGLGFMLAELPNSFFKRQLNIAPGDVPRSGLSRAVCLVLDRVDSALGVLIAVSLLAPVPAMTWLWVLLIGPGLHALFSALLFRLGIKERML